MWIAIAGAFVLVTVLFGHSQQRESSNGSTHQPTVAELVEPGLLPHTDGTPTTYKRD